MKKKLTDDDIANFLGRLRHLETMWDGCTTTYNVDMMTGRGDVSIGFADSETALRLVDFDIRRLVVVGKDWGKKPPQSGPRP